jgi:6,7-dimethyl-8-ribityllumazine synthase
MERQPVRFRRDSRRFAASRGAAAPQARRTGEKPISTRGRDDMKIHQGKLQAKGFRIAIVVSRFNSFISERLLEGALEALQKMGAQEADLTVYKVPGSFEVPLIAKKVAKAKAADGILCIGALIRGDTPHFDYLSAEVTKGLAQIAMDDGVPVSFGILTVDTVEQGIERAGTKAGNKGYDAAFSLVETLSMIKEAGLR